MSHALKITPEDRQRWINNILENSPLPAPEWRENILAAKEPRVSVNTDGEFFAVIDMARHGSIVIHSVSRGNDTNRALWVFSVSYPTRVEVQPEMIL